MIVPVVPPSSSETKRTVHRGRTYPRQRLHCARCITALRQVEIANLASEVPRSLFGTIGGQLVTLDPVTGGATARGTHSGLTSIRSLTYHAARNELLGLAHALSGEPQLIRIDRVTGATTVVGPLEFDGALGLLSTAKGLAYNPADGVLYGSFGTANRADQFSVIDPDTAVATPISQINGTVENEAVSMIFVAGRLYITDLGGSAELYTLNSASGVAEGVCNTGALNLMADLALSPTTGNLQSHGLRELVEIDRFDCALTTVGPTHDATEFGGDPGSGVSWAPDPAPSIGN